MKLSYDGKTAEADVLAHVVPARLRLVRRYSGTSFNRLILGENLQVMKALLADAGVAGRVDLVYIDPPFSTNCIYRHNGKRTATVSSSREDDVAYTDKLKGGEFIEFLRQRLILIRELMSDRSSIYVHIDCKIGHYVKVIMDEIFGPKNFRSDISRVKCNPKNFERYGYSNSKDMILFYSKSKDFIWNEPRGEFSDDDILRLFPKVDSYGRHYTTTPLHAPGETKEGNTGKAWKGLLPPRGRHWRYKTEVLDELDSKGLIERSGKGNPRKIVYAEEAVAKGKRLQDIWEFKDEQYPCYPTAKNPKLLERIVQTSSNTGALVLDCFCGSGTTLVAAERLARKWIGIDNSEIAIKTAIDRLVGDAVGDLLGSAPDFAQYEQVKSASEDQTGSESAMHVCESAGTYARKTRKKKVRRLRGERSR